MLFSGGPGSQFGSGRFYDGNHLVLSVPSSLFSSLFFSFPSLPGPLPRSQISFSSSRQSAPVTYHYSIHSEPWKRPHVHVLIRLISLHRLRNAVSFPSDPPNVPCLDNGHEVILILVGDLLFFSLFFSLFFFPCSSFFLWFGLVWFLSLANPSPLPPRHQALAPLPRLRRRTRVQIAKQGFGPLCMISFVHNIFASAVTLHQAVR